jgi:hypothetical protein
MAASRRSIVRPAGVTALCPEMLAFEWMRACTHPSFKTLLAEIKGQALG